MQRGETPALIFFKPARLLNQGRGDNGGGTTDQDLTMVKELLDPPCMSMAKKHSHSVIVQRTSPIRPQLLSQTHNHPTPFFPKKWYFTSQTTLFLERSPIYKEKPGTVVEKPKQSSG